MSGVTDRLKWFNHYIGAIALASTLGMFAFIVDSKITQNEFREHIRQSNKDSQEFRENFKDQSRINLSILQFAESFKDLKENGGTVIRDYSDKKDKELEDRMNIRIDDLKSVVGRAERESRLAQSRLDKFNLFLKENKITIEE